MPADRALGEGEGGDRLSNSYKEAHKKEESKGHNHPISQKCGPHCPRNEHYKGRERKIDPFHRNK